MAGEKNATTALLYMHNGVNYADLVGQIEITSNLLGAPINTSTKDNNDFVELMNGELAGKGITITGSIVYSSAASFRLMRDAAIAGGEKLFHLDFNGDLETDIIFFNGIPTALSDALPMGDKITTSISILSTGAVIN